MVQVGFEPTPFYGLEPNSSALDRSAIAPSKNVRHSSCK
jgi:hypothetical protein